jgi:hypothetical protein
MIRKVYKVEPLICPRCGGMIKVVAFITDWIRSEEVHCAAVPRDTAADESKKASKALS